MEADYWLDKWAENNIGFHQESVNKRLKEYWAQINVPDDACVFVPLCGKTLDMLWLHEQGHRILGVELSSKATEAFFIENQLPYREKQQGNFKVFCGVDRADGIELWTGDLFDLKSSQIEHCCAFYDRASLIAMNTSLRSAYAKQIATLLNSHTQGLLLAIAYDESRMQGPPFSVPNEQVIELFDEAFEIKELANYCGPERVGNLAKRGLETLEERVYFLQRKSE